MNPQSLMYVMYGPIHYAHADHRAFFHADLAQLPASFANQLMIGHHRLDTAIDFTLTDAPFVQQCIDHWTQIPRVCYLIGVQRLRAALVEHGRYAYLDPSSQRFLCLPLYAVPEAECKGVPDDDAIATAGAACIVAALFEGPRAIHQRLPLLFSKSVSTRVAAQFSDEHDRRVVWHSSLFSFAVNHALLDFAATS